MGLRSRVVITSDVTCTGLEGKEVEINQRLG